jgi:hypothetical protein
MLRSFFIVFDVLYRWGGGMGMWVDVRKNNLDGNGIRKL